MEDYSDKMSSLVKTMNELAMDKSLSKYALLQICDTLPNFGCYGIRNCTSLIMQVIELSATKWRSAPAPTRPSPAVGKKSDASSGLNTNATPFVPSESLLTETVYDMPVPQQPVSCACEWV